MKHNEFCNFAEAFMKHIFRRRAEMGTTDQKNTTEDSAKGVRERLLDVAEGLFAERGFEGTSIR